MPNFEILFFQLHAGVATYNAELLKICRSKKAREILLKQQEAINRVTNDYLNTIEQEKSQPLG